MRAYLERLTDRLTTDRAGLLQEIDRLKADFIRDNLPADASPQAVSVASRFALVAAGGELTTALGVTGWPDGEAERSAAVCFQAWLDRRGGSGDRENQLALRQVQAFIEAHGTSRFEPVWDDDYQRSDVRIINRVGFRKKDACGDWTYYILPESWRGEVCKGFDARIVAETLRDQGMLDGEVGKTSKVVRIHNVGKMRVYVLSPRILAGFDDARPGWGQ